MIDDTPIGQFLEEFEGVGVYVYFSKHPDVPTSKKEMEAKEVWAHASLRFIESLWGRVYTTICGADRGGVYYTVEIPAIAAPIVTMVEALAKAKDVEFIRVAAQ